MERPVVMIIDMLNDFVTGSLRSERGSKIIPPLAKLIHAARKNKIPVVYTNDAHYKTDFEVVSRWGDHAIKGTPGADVIPELKPAEQDFIVEKRTYSSFYDTGLDSLLRSLYKGDGIKTVILGGLHTNICVRHTSADAFFRGYKIVIAKDGVEAFTEEAQTSGLAYLKDVYNAEIKTVDDIVKEFANTS
jgi:nicotinamidase-related amidase